MVVGSFKTTHAVDKVTGGRRFFMGCSLGDPAGQLATKIAQLKTAGCLPQEAKALERLEPVVTHRMQYREALRELVVRRGRKGRAKDDKVWETAPDSVLKSLRRYYDVVDAAVGEWVPGMEKQRGMVVPEPSMAPGLAPKQQRRLAGLKKMVRCPDGTPVVVPSKAKSGKGKDDIYWYRTVDNHTW